MNYHSDYNWHTHTHRVCEIDDFLSRVHQNCGYLFGSSCGGSHSKSSIVLWGPLWGPPIPGNYPVQPCNPICVPSCHCVSSLMIIVTPSGTSCARNLAHITLGREKGSFYICIDICIYLYIRNPMPEKV